MSLTLTVLSFKSQPIFEIASVVIGNSGGGIGRSDDNVLVLPDTEKFVSRHHATISFENGGYYLSDTSLGGVFISNRDTPLHNATERIENGMTLRVGEYEIAVAIAEQQEPDDFLFAPEPIRHESNAFVRVDEPWFEADDVGFNSLMNDNFASHEELVQEKPDRHPAAFESGLQGNHSPLFDSYIAPSIMPAASEQIPENFSFDDLFSETDMEIKPQIPAPNKPVVDNDFEDFFGAAIKDMEADIHQPKVFADAQAETVQEADAVTWTDDQQSDFAVPPLNDTSISNFDDGALADLFTDNQADIEMPPLVNEAPVIVIKPEIASRSDDNKISPETIAVSIEKSPANKILPADSVLFNAFLQGAAIECNEIHPEQQAETLHRIGQMFRKLIDGTVAVLRSRAEFKSLCRVNMTVIRAANNNPLKFTVATDDVLRQLIENNTGGFLASTAAIDESFNDIMNHQLAMQAGIQASLVDLLKTFDPKIIEKQFEQGIVLQKKAKCWDSYEETYRNTVEDAVENFFGEEFVKAYEKQMSQLTNARRK